MMWLLLLGCVLNRTGQSAPDKMAKELADHARRLAEMEAVSEDVSHRVSQLEEVGRARGQEEILKMETMEQLRQEVANLRGDVETMAHDYRTFEAAGIGFQTDADWRMGYQESRLAAVEKSLGVRPAPPPPRDGTVAPVEPPPTGDPVAPPDAPPADPPAALSPDDSFGLIAQNLQEGKGAAARAVANRFVAEFPTHDRVPEARYRIAESYQNEAAFAEAITAFQVVIDKHGDSTWAPWSMLRQGECFLAMGKKTEARLFWEDVTKRYPKSKAAKEAKTQLAK